MNTLHNIAHLALGAVLIWGSMSAAITTVNKAMAVASAALTAYLGFFASGAATSRI